VLVISIVLVLLASVGLHRYLLKPPLAGDAADEQRYKQQYNVAATQVGFSAIALAAAASLFAAFGVLVISGHGNKINAQLAIARALAVTAHLPQLNGATLAIDSLADVEPQGGVYNVVVANAQTQDRYLVIIDKASGDATQVRKQP
jgi:hypothetical protein